jgi:GT2 family glycosyltransferase
VLLNQEQAMPLVTIVIPMLNEVTAIERCIRSLLDQDYPADLIEINVVDGMSKDGSRKVIEGLNREIPRIKLLDNPERRTPKALNIGIRNASGSVIIILGAHTRIDKRFVSLNIKYQHEKNVSCVGGTQINVGDTFLQQTIGVAMGSVFGMPSAPYRFRKQACYVDTVVYASYRRHLFEEVGFFDEELHIAEDAEFNWRIRQMGHKIFYSPDIVSYYYPRETLDALAKQFFNYGILRVNVIKKHFDAFKWIHIVPPAFVFLFIALSLAGLIHRICWHALILVMLLYFL